MANEYNEEFAKYQRVIADHQSLMVGDENEDVEVQDSEGDDITRPSFQKYLKTLFSENSAELNALVAGRMTFETIGELELVTSPTIPSDQTTVAAEVLNDSADDNNGLYVWDVSESEWVKSPYSANSANQDILIDFTPSYSNKNGTGDRTASIIVSSSSGLISSGAASNLIDGGFTNNSSEAIVFNSVAALDNYLLFDFGANANILITEAKLYQANTSTHGAWKWQGSDDASVFADIGSSFTLGGATEQVQDSLSANLIGYRYYRLIGVSGATSGSPYLQEIEFKIARTFYDESWKGADFSMFPEGFPTSKLAAAYFFDETDGTTVIDQLGLYDIDLTLPTDPNFTVKKHGISLSSGLIQTPEILSTKSQTILYKCNPNATSGFLISGGAGSGNGTTQQNLATAETHFLSGFGLDTHTPINSNGGGAYGLNTGGWAMYTRSMDTNYDSVYGFGGRHSTTTSRCTSFDINTALIWNDDLTTGELEIVYRFIRGRAAKHNIYLHRDDTPTKADLYAIYGESTADGRSTISDLSASDQSLNMRNTLIGVCSEGFTDYRTFDSFELGYNQQVTDVSNDFGIEFGVAYQRRTEFLNTRQNANAAIVKLGKGGSRIAPSSTGISATTTWNTGEDKTSGLFWRMAHQTHRMLQQYISRGVGFGGTVKVGLLIGLNDMTSTTYTVDAATYQSYLQSFLDNLETVYSGVNIDLTIYRAHSADPSADPTAAAHVRTATDAFAVANSNVTAIDTDSYGLEPDGVHYDAAASKTMGINLHG